MSWYKIASLIEHISYPDRYMDIQDVIETLHELELKHHYIDTLPELFIVNQRRKENVQKRIKELAFSYFEFSKYYIEKIFNSWKEQHRIQNAEEFTEMVLDELRENFRNDENIINNVLQHGLSRGVVSIPPNMIRNYFDKESFEESVRDTFSYSPDVYDYLIEQYLNENLDGWEDEGLSPADYMEEHDLNDEIENYVVRNTEYDDNLTYTIEDLKVAIRDGLYNDYMITFGGGIEEVIENVDEAINRMDEISENDDVSKMTAAISLALSVMHVNGKIINDYSGDIDKKFLDYISSKSPLAEDWKEEIIEQFFGKKPEDDIVEGVKF